MGPRPLLQAGLGLLVSIVFGWLALRSISLHGVWAGLRAADYAWLVPAVAALGVALWLRALRWRALFPAEQARVTPSVAFWTLIVGLFFNNVLPARAGEAARIVALNREAGVPRTQGAVAVVVERVYDIGCLAVLLLVSLLLLPGGELVRRLALTAAVLVAAIALAVLVLARAVRRPRPRLRATLERVPVVGGRRTEATVRSLSLGLRTVIRPRHALPVAWLTLLSWLALAVSNWCCMQAISRDWPWHAALFVLIVTNLAMVIPAGAGSIGVFEAAARAALAAYSVRGSAAISFALVLHALNVLPYLLLGAPALGRLGLRARDVRPGPASERPLTVP